MIGWIILCLLAVLVAVLLIRTALFRPKEAAQSEPEAVSFDAEAALRALGELVRCRTVSNYDRGEEDDAECE